MLAQGADIVLGQLLTLVDKAANFAHKALLLRIGSGLHVLLVVGVGHGFRFVQLYALSHVADKHGVRLQIHLADYLAGDIAVGILIQEQQAVAGALGMGKARKLIGGSAGLEANLVLSSLVNISCNSFFFLSKSSMDLIFSLT